MSTEIILKPGDNVPDCYAVQSLAGVRAPRSVRLFDARQADSAPTVKRMSACGKYALTLWGSERIEFMLGIDSTTPESCTTYRDARTCAASELARQMHNIRSSVARMLWAYRKARRNPAKKGNGGSCIYRPRFVAICNYGWSIHAERNDYVVQTFGVQA